MSEKIYGWLLRLYPSHFRELHGEEALQLFRDRASHEVGFTRRLYLWLDLLADLILSLPREYVRRQPVLAGATVYRRSDGLPSFFLLADQLPRPEALFSGCVLTVSSLVICSILLGHVGNANYVALTAASGPSRGESAIPSRPFSQSELSSPAGASASASTDPNLAVLERKRIIDGAIANLKAHYVDRELAQVMAGALIAHEQRGDYDGVSNAPLATLLTSHMRAVSHDLHLAMIYSDSLLPDQPHPPTSEEVARYRSAMQQAHCTLENVEILPHNIGYLKLNSFPDLSVCQSSLAAAMGRLNNADAIIFDLRDNRGGEPETVVFLAAYLFDHPEFMYNPRENTTAQNWTRSPVPENKLANKPAYILTSSSTASAAEHFSYDLKMLNRATIVGETTAGADHSGVWYRLDDHFGMAIPETKPNNPFSTADWAETGVRPDVPVKAPNALQRAQKLAWSKIQKR
jgi:hypothetical protein